MICKKILHGDVYKYTSWLNLKVYEFKMRFYIKSLIIDFENYLLNLHIDLH